MIFFKDEIKLNLLTTPLHLQLVLGRRDAPYLARRFNLKRIRIIRGWQYVKRRAFFQC